MTVIDNVLNNKFADFFGLLDAFSWNIKDIIDEIFIIINEIGFEWDGTTS